MKNTSKLISTLLIFCLATTTLNAAQPFIVTKDETTHRDVFTLHDSNSTLSIYCNPNIDKGIRRAIVNLQSDFGKVTGVVPLLITDLPSSAKPLVIVGTIGTKSIVDDLVKAKKIDANVLKDKREKYLIQNIKNPMPGVDEALVIAGSDKRGTIYGIYELSQQIGVSPWYYWADVPVAHKDKLYFKKGIYTDGEPAVEYRGIFINDEWPAMGGWATATFGGFNSKMYEHMFELILRLKGNFLWPAMWEAAFYSDDPLNGPLADEMGIVIGTSHHEPMGKAHLDWRKTKQNYGNAEWNYTTNEQALDRFFREGMERLKNWEAVVTIGMRGDGDEAMEEGTNIALLEKVVKNQRKIIEEVTGKKANQTPQVWALYKEVQDYYDQGMRVPDDVILLYCDDNWGNVRKLPDLTKKGHKGGYGMYYHFDYVGAPRNSKWININPIQRIWEQMNLTYEHGVDRLWVVNVGDLKPMEYPISFFLDMAWNPEQFNAQNLFEHTKTWATQQFGAKHADEIARIINLYAKYNRRVTPEMLNANTYSLDHYNEFETVLADYRALALDALRLYNQIPNEYRDSYFQLVLYPVDACCNLYEMYFAQARNRQLAIKSDPEANRYADKVKACFERDSLLQNEYNNVIAGGKWKHMMDQTKIGYRYWQQPEKNRMPEVVYVAEANPNPKVFVESNGYVSIEAEHFTRLNNSERIRWEVIPDFGKTKSGITTFPQKLTPFDNETIYIEYDVLLASEAEVEVSLYLAPTLNYNDNKGLRYEISFDGATPQTVNFNGHYRGELAQWQAQHIIVSNTKHTINTAGKHSLRIRVLDPGIVFEKIIINTGGLKPSYLGAPESNWN